MHTIDFIELQRLLNDVCEKIDDNKFLPDRVVALSPNGTITGRMISEYFNVPLTNISWGKDEDEREHNCWISEDASNGQQMLIVMDRYDEEIITTFCKDLDESSGGDEWEYNVRFVSLVCDKKKHTMDYVGIEVDEQCRLPWDLWWG